MKDGFVKAAAGSVDVCVADTLHNTEKIVACVKAASDAGVQFLVLPELCVTGYTCHDLFFSDTLLQEAKSALQAIGEQTKNDNVVFAVGCPLAFFGKLFNCAVVFLRGEVLGVVPKTAVPNYGEFYEMRQFVSGDVLHDEVCSVVLNGKTVPFGSGLVFSCAEMPTFSFGIEICEDLWVADPPSRKMTENGALIIGNLSASDEVVGKSDYRRMLVCSTSARLMCGYVYANAAPGESTQDQVFSSHHLLGENGVILAENEPFGKRSVTVTEFDVSHLAHDRRVTTTYKTNVSGKKNITFSYPVRETVLTRKIPQNPFVPDEADLLSCRGEEILTIQAYGLKKRIAHARAKTAVIGISGGLDSTLALLACVRAFDLLQRPRKEICCVTMPCFGTTKRTKSNAVRLCEALGVTVDTVDISESVNMHFRDIGHDPTVYDVTFENAQARERTQVLMDIANRQGGIVVGTGDLSELALGWATYNGDHMSMYGVNASIPKTLVRCIVRYEAQRFGGTLGEILSDILDTPVSPELLPCDENGEIAQKTEDLVGPYELHDFFLYHFLRFGEAPEKIYRLAKYAYGTVYSDKEIAHWLKTFVRRFFVSQFKRSCLPDGPKVGSVTLSPRGDFRMPSDAVCRIWLDEAESL